MLRQATSQDFNQLRTIYQAQVDEAEIKNKKLKFDVETAIELTRERLIENTSNILIYIRDEKIVGYAVVNLCQITWNKTRTGNIEMFFIHPEYRKKISSHKFLDQIEEYLRDNDVELMLSNVFLFDSECNVDNDYVNRASDYFEAKGMKWCGNWFVKEL